MAAMIKLNNINESQCIEKIYNDFQGSIKISLILTSINISILIILLILILMAKFEFYEKICRFVFTVFLTFIFEILFNILMIIFLPKESDYKKEKLNYIYELEKELSNAKNINQALLGIELIIFFLSVFKLISFIFDKCNDYNYKIILKRLILIQLIFIILEWSMPLEIISKINKLRKNIKYNNSTKNIRNNIIRFIILINIYVILIIAQIIFVKCDDNNEYSKSPLLVLFKPISITNILEIGINIVILVLFPYSNYYKKNYFYQVYNGNLYNNNTKYNITENDIYNLEELYIVPKRLNKTILSFCIIILVISLIKFILYLYNKCNHIKDYKFFHIFNFFNLVLLFINLFFGIIHIIKINTINIDTSTDIFFLSEKIKSNLLNKNLVIIILFICYIILSIIPIIILLFFKKKVKIIERNYSK